MIDLPLLRLRYEILNISLAELASEIEVPLSLLEKEAKSNKWSQWWPAEQERIFLEKTSTTSTTVTPTPGFPSTPHSDQDELTTDSSNDGFDDLSPLEEGAQLYIKDARVRLQVFTLAKEIHFAHKYASLESALINRAKDMVDLSATPLDVRNLVLSLKDLPGKMAAAGLQITPGDDGVPMVIIRDLSGR